MFFCLPLEETDDEEDDELEEEPGFKKAVGRYESELQPQPPTQCCNYVCSFFSLHPLPIITTCIFSPSFPSSLSFLPPPFSPLSSLSTLPSAPYEDIDSSDHRRTMQRMLNEQNEDEVEAYYKDKYASGHSARWVWFMTRGWVENKLLYR